jgi:hypothetical protein
MLAYLNKQAQIKGSKANKHQQEIEGKIERVLLLSILAYIHKQAFLLSTFGA